MQSLLQYRRAGAAAQAQIDRDVGKAREHMPSDTTRDVEASKPPVRRHPRKKDENGLRRGLSRVIEEQYVDEDGQEEPVPIQPSITAETIRQCMSGGVALGQVLTGIQVRPHKNDKGEDSKVFVVKWEGPDDPLDPHNWSVGRRIGVTLQISVIALFVGAASGIDATVLPQASKSLGVSEVAESLATGMSNSPFCPYHLLTTFIPRSLSSWYGSRVISCRPILRNLWQKRSLHRLHGNLHDLDHGICPCPQLWSSDSLSFSGRLLSFDTSCMLWRFHCRHVQQPRKDLELSALCSCWLWWADDRCCHGRLYRSV